MREWIWEGSMHSARHMAGSPWPPGMVITVDDNPEPLLELLWVREVFGLQPRGSDLPPALDDPPPSTGEGVGEPTAAWDEAWPGIWRACLDHAAITRDQAVLGEMFDRLSRTDSDSPERAQILRQWRGPSWRDRFGSSAFTERYISWRDRSRGSHTTGAVNDPEGSVVDPLIRAWEAGLTKVVQIPCRGSFTRVIGPHALLVTARTRADLAGYREALGAFH